MNSLNLSSFSMTDDTEQAYQYSFPGESLYKDYKPVTRDLIPLPKAVLYLLMGALVVVAVAYVIVGHLIKDIVSDVVDRVLGPNEDDMEKQSDLRGITLSHIPTALPLSDSNTCSVMDQDDGVIPLPSEDSASRHTSPHTSPRISPQTSPQLLAATPFTPSFFPHPGYSHIPLSTSSTNSLAGSPEPSASIVQDV